VRDRADHRVGAGDVPLLAAGRRITVGFLRTPIGRFAGSLAKVRADDLAAIPIRELIARNPALAEAVDEVYFGCANQAGEDNRNVARMALLLAGLPETVRASPSTGSAPRAWTRSAAARAIKAGEIELAIAGGVESMTRAPLVMGKARPPSSARRRSSTPPSAGASSTR
jgi:3-oxoadipyl-CoA thiolase